MVTIWWVSLGHHWQGRHSAVTRGELTASGLTPADGTLCSRPQRQALPFSGLLLMLQLLSLKPAGCFTLPASAWNDQYLFSQGELLLTR